MQWTTIMIALGALSTQAFGAAIDTRFNNDSPSLMKRVDFDHTEYFCHDGVVNGRKDQLRDGIDYLRSIGGTPEEAPNTCGRVSCSYNTAIYWCNNNDETHYLRSYATIADGAQWLLDTCGGDGSPGGEVYTPDNWGVRVVVDAC
ncbi:hypothetical protein BDW59DRAFT_162370 [Aspergillus cavernicola]|uniref:Uncharacterized protein n=1 Tax=Aspergillus cavernicola TaxID=176166 RepID=A0ABR4I9T2_9EURO